MLQCYTILCYSTLWFTVISYYTPYHTTLKYITLHCVALCLGQEDFNRLVIDGSVLSEPEVLATAHQSMAELAAREGMSYTSRHIRPLSLCALITMTLRVSFILSFVHQETTMTFVSMRSIATSSAWPHFHLCFLHFFVSSDLMLHTEYFLCLCLIHIIVSHIM